MFAIKNIYKYFHKKGLTYMSIILQVIVCNQQVWMNIYKMTGALGM